MIAYIIQLIRTYCYNFWLGNSFFSVSTPQLYREMLDYVDKESSILEVGVGSGMPLIVNERVIFRKKLKLHGIDIDSEYIAACKEVIQSSIISGQVFIEQRNIFDIPISNKYDAIVFSESYPVIPETLMSNMVEHCKKLLNKNGKIIFIHNLLEKESQLQHPIALIKPYIKYIPFVWIDFGRATTKQHFESWLSSFDMKFQNELLVSHKIPAIFGDYKIEQYIYVVQ